MIDRLQIVAQARLWVGTPYMHQARVRGAGVDCAGLIMGVGKELDLLDVTYNDYGQLPHQGLLRSICDRHLTPLEELEEGCVLLMAFLPGPAQEQHLAIYSGSDSIIHAYANVGRCVEHRLSLLWRARIRQAYRYPGVN